jgi:hypothetical protein
VDNRRTAIEGTLATTDSRLNSGGGATVGDVIVMR